ELREAIRATGIADPRIQLVNDGAAVRIQTGALDQDAEDAMVDAISAVTGTNRIDASIEAVGPTFGALVARQALIALVVFLAAAALFITIRLQWKMAMAGLVALFHDLIITVGIYALTGFEVTPATVVAILTILGYSLYDTVVVFDKVREFEADLADVLPYEEIVNRSMNQVLVRSLATSLTSLLPVGSLLFVGAILLGAASLQEFALALFVGIGVGTYSSIFVAGPLLAKWRGGEAEWVEHRERLEKRAAAKEARTAPSVQPSGTDAPQQAPAGVIARPPKQKRRRR
ncbi:MAG: protein translocase subunit SecF, partial [Acidimicrobiia bacterium]|nr:protein translocase subunit SecF [Acidimicrobiia bacterium]